MESSARANYLAGAVLTASPQKLHLMLIEGAIRFVERARQHWQAGENEQGFEALIRAQDIVGQMLVGLNHEEGTSLVRQVAALYTFILRRLAEGTLHHDEAKLKEALRVLEIERETWQQVCRGLEPDKTAETPAPRTPHFPPFGAPTEHFSDLSAPGLSLEA